MKLKFVEPVRTKCLGGLDRECSWRRVCIVSLQQNLIVVAVTGGSLRQSGFCEARFNEILSSLSKVKRNLSEYAIRWQEFQGILHWVDFSCFLLENVWQLFF